MARARPKPDESRAWQRMLSGRRLDLLDPSPFDIEMSDVAHGLARVARWNGQTVGDHAFSVAQHSLLVEKIAGLMQPDAGVVTRLHVLLHDAPEYVIGDMISPFKAVIGGDYKAVEKRLLGAIHLRYGLPAEAPSATTRLVKAADRIAAFYEATRLAGFDHAEALTYFGAPHRAVPEARIADLIAPMPTRDAEAAFLARFETLAGAVGKVDETPAKS